MTGMGFGLQFQKYLEMIYSEQKDWKVCYQGKQNLTEE